MTEKYYNKLVVKATQLRTYKKWEHIIREFHFETGKQALKLGGIGLSCLLTLLFIARPFLQRMISIDYLVLYQSYEQTVSTVVNFFVTDYGVVIILFTITALAIGAYRRLLDSSVTLFLALFGTLSTVLWAVIPRQIGVQYPLHLALVVILGLTAFGRILWSIPNLPIRWIGITSFTGILILNMIAGLAPIKLPSEVSGALALNHPPLFREDYNEVVSLVAYLRQITKSNNMIYIVDSSGLMNFDLVQKAERDLYGFKNTKLYIPFSAQVDSRDFYPLELLIRADYIVITTPLQTHLGENQQKVVKYVFDAFEQNWEIARDFKRLPVEFKLSNGAILSIYKRQNNTSFETSLATFNQMVKYVDRIPGNQDDWILVSRNYYGHAIKNVNQNYSFILIPSDEIPDTRAIFLFAKPLPAFGNVQGKVYFLNNQCSQVSVSLRQFQVSGNLLTEKNQVVSKNSGTFELSFQSQVGTNNILVLDAQNDYQTPSEKFCSFRLEWK